MPSKPPLPCLWMESTESQLLALRGFWILESESPGLDLKALRDYPEGISSPSSAAPTVQQGEHPLGLLDVSASRKQEPLNSG